MARARFLKSRFLKLIAAHIGLLICIGMNGCTMHNPHFDSEKPHHTPTGFKNNYPHESAPSFADLARWRWQARELPELPQQGYTPPVRKPDVSSFVDQSHASITWLGHATFLYRIGGKTFLTDPHLSARASPFKRFGPRRLVSPPLAIAELPHIDYVVISHNHYDHLDRQTVLALNEQPGGAPRYFVPLALKKWFTNQDIDDVVELDWWGSRQEAQLTIHFVPAQHWSARTRLDRNESLWGGWVIEHAGFRFYFAGDTGYSKDFEDIGSKFSPIDLAAIPIGAYDPRWFMKAQHVNPSEALQIHQDIGARYSVGMHWGTFKLTDEPIDEPPNLLAEARKRLDIRPEQFFVMEFGETRALSEFEKPP